MTLRKIAIMKDTARPMLGLHGLHVAFQGLPGVEIAALVDTNPENLAAKLAATRARNHYLSLPQMLDQERPDIVVLCSRHPADHFPQIREAARRGVHVYCEKPLTTDLAEADAILALAQQHRIQIGMAHPARHALAFRTMKELIDAGEIGTPLTAYGRGKCDHRGGGEDLIVLGTHILDLQTFLFGAPESVWAEVRMEGSPITAASRRATVEPLGPVAGDEVFATFRFPGGVRGIFESRQDLFVRESGNIYMGLTVMGTRGALSLRFNDSFAPHYRLRISRLPAPVEDRADYQEVPLRETRQIPGASPLDYSLCGTADIPREPFFLEANRFAAFDLLCAIDENRLPASNLYHARQALEMIYGIYAAHLTGGTVPFPLQQRKHPLEP